MFANVFVLENWPDGAMTVLLATALQPNLVQTMENNPCLMHGGPFANIAHGNSSVVGDLIGIRGSDYLITEAGVGADAEILAVAGETPETLLVAQDAYFDRDGRYNRPGGDDHPAKLSYGAGNLS